MSHPNPPGRRGRRPGAGEPTLEGICDAFAPRYAVEREVGRGGTATVYLAEDRKHHRRVAIKVLRPEVAEGIGAERFLREIRTAATLTHPHIVPLHDSGEMGGLLYYVMPYVEGESLRDRLKREGRLPVEDAVRIAREVADALSHAHARRVVHRDVKPANILLSEGHALLTDFGVARAVEAASDDLTVTGLVVGTPVYMSPEQAAGDEALDARSDVFSLGCVLYEMLAGRRPFPGASPLAVLAGHILERPTGLVPIRPDVTPELHAVVERALQKEPGERYADGVAFARALGAVESPRRSRWMPSAVVVALPLALLTVLAIVLGVPRLGGSTDLSDREGSVIVLPFRDAIQTPAEDTLLLALADELTRQLNRWDSVRAIPQVSLSGATFDLGLEGPLLEDIDDGLRVARGFAVEALITLNARIRGDSAEVTANRFDPRRGSSVGRPLEARGARADPVRLAAAIAHALLGLEGPVESVERLRSQSSNAAALQYYREGLDLLERWRLTEAEQAFRAATGLDSTFAMGHHYLAVALYWQAGDEPTGMTRLGPEAARRSRAALRHAQDLPAAELDHVRALNRFLEGDFQAAREGYDALVARDSADVYAWLFRGIVEFRDPWLVEQPDGSLRPRSDWNAAVRSFSRTVRLSPGFHLGYGHLFDITAEVLRSADEAGAPGFRLPANEHIPPWERVVDPESQQAFHPVYLDSLVWLHDSEYAPTDRAAGREGATQLLESSIRTLRRWAAFAPDEARPHAELSDWTLWQRFRLVAPQPPQRLDSLARAARDHAERALALTTDTLSGDLVHLANLYLATDESERAGELVQRAIEVRPQGAPLPRSASNVLLYRGEWREALELLESEPTRARFFEDPESGELGGDGGVEPLVLRLEVLGATGVTGVPLESTLQELEVLWERPPEGTAPIPRLRRHQAPRIAPALASAPDVLRRWRVEGGLDDPLWAAVDPSTPDVPAAIRVALETADRDVGEPERSYLLGTAALGAGDTAAALRLLTRLDSVPLNLQGRDPGWGLRALSLFHRAEAYRSSGDTVRAAMFYRRFLETRVPGGDAAPFEHAARERLARQARSR